MSPPWSNTNRRLESTRPEYSGERLTPERNSEGGIAISDAEVQAAFDHVTRGRGLLTRDDLTRTLHNVLPGFSSKDVKALVGEDGLDFDTLHDILNDNILRSDDPYAEVFRALDVSNTGYADERALHAALEASPAVGTATDEEVKHLIGKADADGDSRIDIYDFERMTSQRVEESSAGPMSAGSPRGLSSSREGVQMQ